MSDYVNQQIVFLYMSKPVCFYLLALPAIMRSRDNWVTSYVPHRPTHGGSEGPPGLAGSALPLTHPLISGTLWVGGSSGTRGHTKETIVDLVAEISVCKMHKAKLEWNKTCNQGPGSGLCVLNACQMSSTHLLDTLLKVNGTNMPLSNSQIQSREIISLHHKRNKNVKM